jgi:hypothetical protein
MQPVDRRRYSARDAFSRDSVLNAVNPLATPAAFRVPTLSPCA